MGIKYLLSTTEKAGILCRSSRKHHQILGKRFQELIAAAHGCSPPLQ
jgi:hypothetical protein